MRIVFVINSLGGGGAERVAVNLVGHWKDIGHEVTLVTAFGSTSDAYAAPVGIERISLRPIDVTPVRLRRIRRILRRFPFLKPVRTLIEVYRQMRRFVQLRRAILGSQPDVVVSFIDRINIATLLSTLGSGVAVVVSERTDPREHKIPWFWSVLRRLLYRSADALVVQTQSVGEWALGITKPDRVRVIPNAAATAALVPVAPRADLEEMRVVAMGRLHRDKGFDLLVAAFARCARSHPNWRLVIFGQGSEHDALMNLAARLGVSDRVDLPGFTDDPIGALACGDLFVISSRFEGFPNTLLEAMACGVAVVSTNCRSGPAEIIRDGVDGLLVATEDVTALAVVMDRLMSDPVERARLGKAARSVLDRFAPSVIYAQWDELLGDVVAPGR